MKTGYLWAIARDDGAHGGTDPPAVVYTYMPGRGKVWAEKLLGDFTGMRPWIEEMLPKLPEVPIRSRPSDTPSTTGKTLSASLRMGGSSWTTTPSSGQSGPSPSCRHSAHVGRDVVIWYRWHPYFERTVRCEYVEERATGRVAHIVVRHGEVIVVPAWMLDREACEAFNLGSPQVTVDALTDLHTILLDRGFRNGLLSGSNAQEVIDEDLALVDAIASTAAVDHAARLPAPSTV